MAQETEDLELDEKTVQAGVQAILSDPAKGTYFLLEVGFRFCARQCWTQLQDTANLLYPLLAPGRWEDCCPADDYL